MKSQWQDDLASLYQETRLEVPPAELDQQIRNAAKRSIQKKPHHFKWYLSSAAVLLLSVNIVLYTVDQEPERVEFSPFAVSPPAARSKLSPGNQPDMAEAEIPLSAQQEEKAFANDSAIAPNELAQEFKRELQQPIATQNLASPAAPPDDGSTLRSLQQRKSEPEIRLPDYLPFDVEQLIAGQRGLSGQKEANKLSIYQAGKLLLRMSRQAQGILIQAYQGADRWGIQANWGQSADLNQQCVKAEYLICDLNTKVQGGYQDNQLVFIRWVQVDES